MKRTKEVWIKQGNGNTEFFHNYVYMRDNKKLYRISICQIVKWYPHVLIFLKE
jgi:hypothetical protein